MKNRNAVPIRTIQAVSDNADTTVRFDLPTSVLLRGKVTRATANCSRIGLPFLAQIPHATTLSIPPFGAVSLRLAGYVGELQYPPGNDAFEIGSDLLPRGCSVWIHRNFAAQLLGRLLGESEFEPIAHQPSPGQLGLLSALLWRVLQRLGGRSATCDTDSAPEGGMGVFQVDIDFGSDSENPIRGALTVGIDTRCLRSFGVAGAGNARALANHLEHIPIEAAIELATVAFSVHDMDRLHEGDVVVFSAYPHPGRLERVGEMEGRIRIGAFVADCFLHKNGDVVLQNEFLTDKPTAEVIRPYRGPRMTDATSTNTNNEKTTAILAHAPIQLTVEVGRVALTGADIAGLCNGSILQLGRRVDSPVDLTVGGRLIGRGVLVDVEGELGVRVIDRIG
jgi:type III secretion system YscQ/HrcQ family protein